jgi:FlaG/FlaF family flagellin (archaellin)
MYMDHKRELIFIAVGLVATMSLFVFPSTNMIVHAQLDNKAIQGIKEQAQDRLFNLTGSFNKALKDSGVNLTLPRDGNLTSKLQDLANTDAFKALSAKFAQAVEQLRGNSTANIGELKDANFTNLVQKLKDMTSQ